MDSQRKKLTNAYYRLCTIVPYLVFLLLIVTSCGFPGLDISDQKNTSPAPGGCVPAVPSHRPPLEVALEVDTEPLYPQVYFRAALAAVAERVLQHVTVDSSPLTVFVSYITHDSLNQNAMSFSVPGLPAMPAKPILQTSPDPYKAATLRKQYQSALVCWQKVVDGLQQEVRQVQATVKVETDKLANLPDLYDPIADDIHGALYNASEHLSHFQGVKYLYIASGLQSNTDINQVGNLNFSGVAVSVLDFLCHPASVCVSTQTQFTELFRRYGASSVNFYLPGASELSELAF